MSICPNTGHACRCQPQEGVMCPYGPTPNDWQSIDIGKERAAFEVWIGLNDRYGPKSERAGDSYADNYVGEMWEAWQARAAQPAPIPAQTSDESVMSPERISRLIYQHTGISAQQFPDEYAGMVKLARALLTDPEIQSSAGNALTEEAKDAARLDFMAEHEAWIGWSKDGESCRVFHSDEDGDVLPMLGWGARHWRHSAREAIDAAIASHIKAGQAGKEGS